MNNFFEIIHKLACSGLDFLFFFEAIVLCLRSENNKVKKTLSYILFSWAFLYLVIQITSYGNVGSQCFSLFNAEAIIIGSFYTVVVSLFPLQVIRPQWISWKHCLFICIPLIVLTAFYYSVMNFLRQTPVEIFSYQQLADSFFEFNVWFRFVILLNSILYMCLAAVKLYGYERKYAEWKNKHCMSDYVDLSWMRTFDILASSIYLLFLVTLMVGGRFIVLCHTVLVIVSFSYLFYKVLFSGNPYPLDFFAMDNEKSKELEPVAKQCNNVVEELSSSCNEQVFENKLPSYTNSLKQWMDDEKPYLYTDFKLTDVSRYLPLNRSYLSRIFNEGFGANFSEVIRKYRVNYSIALIQQNPSMPLCKVAELSGFHSDSSFFRAFKEVTSTTPAHFRLTQPVV